MVTILHNCDVDEALDSQQKFANLAVLTALFLFHIAVI